MLLAMAVLLFQFPTPTAPAGLANRPNSAAWIGSSGAVPTETTSRTRAPISHAVAIPFEAGKDTPSAPTTRPSPASVRPRSEGPADASPPQPIIHSFAPPAASLGSLTGASMSTLVLPPPTPFRPPYELPVTHRRLWLALSAAEHSAAGYDAWSTRYALSNGRVEADPLMRPFAGSAAIYPAIQLIPFGLDYLAHRMERSSGWRHRVWWLPQSAATVTFLFSGSYNVAHTN